MQVTSARKLSCPNPSTQTNSRCSLNWKLGTRETWRKPDILVDCVLRLLGKEPGQLTGQALLDEDFLRAEGVTDFSGYSCVPGADPPRISWPALAPARRLVTLETPRGSSQYQWSLAALPRAAWAFCSSCRGLHASARLLS